MVNNHLIFKKRFTLLNLLRNYLTAFSLIETIIAVFILSVGILAVQAIFPLGIQLAKSSKMTTIAAQLAQEKIEEMISKPYGDISSEAKQALTSFFGAYSRETGVTCFDPNNDLFPNCPDTGIKKVEVIVSWGIPEKNIKITILISKK